MLLGRTHSPGRERDCKLMVPSLPAKRVHQTARNQPHRGHRT